MSDLQVYIDMMSDDRIDVTKLLFVNGGHIGLRWNKKDDFGEALPNINVILAAYTTTQARLCLYSLLEGLEDRVLYMGTDSAIYIHRDGKWNPPLGDYLETSNTKQRGCQSLPLFRDVTRAMPISWRMAMVCVRLEHSHSTSGIRSPSILMH